MLFVTYLSQELRHRLRQAVLMAAALAVGVALVITVNAVATGTSDAEAGVLHGLYGLATDITVTRPYSHTDTEPGHEINLNNGPLKHLEFLDDAQEGLFSGSVASSIAHLAGVRAAVPMLALAETNATVGKGAPATLPVSILVDGVDTADQQLGPLSEARVLSGRGLTAADAGASVALVDSGYAADHHLQVGSVITLGYHAFRVVGIVSQPSGTHPAILIPLQTAQVVSGLHHKITTVYVATDSPAAISTVAAKIKAQQAWADVTTSAGLADEISGSLAQTAWLAKDVGVWLTTAVLAAAFALAALLTVASVSRRVREFGTLKALGWSTGRITAQVLGESVTIGIAGALAGVGLGYAAAALISRLASTLVATAAAAPGSSEPHGFVGGVIHGHQFGHQTIEPGTYNSVLVHFDAPVALGVVALAAALGIAGGLLAGAVGGWRAARLRPTVALAQAG